MQTLDCPKSRLAAEDEAFRLGLEKVVRAWRTRQDESCLLIESSPQLSCSLFRHSTHPSPCFLPTLLSRICRFFSQVNKSDNALYFAASAFDSKCHDATIPGYVNSDPLPS